MWGSKNNFGSEINFWVGKNFWVPRNFGLKNFFVDKYIILLKFFGTKCFFLASILWDQHCFVQIYFWRIGVLRDTSIQEVCFFGPKSILFLLKYAKIYFFCCHTRYYQVLNTYLGQKRGRTLVH